MEFTLGPRPRSPQLLALGDGGPDLISALPDDLLLLVLARLPCAGAAARTGILSRRWSGLWPRLRDVPFHSLDPALASVTRAPPTVSLLEIRLSEPQLVDTARLNSLLRAAALLDPEEFFLAFPSDPVQGHCHILDLPCFHRATSIALDPYSSVHGDMSYPIIGRLSTGVEFPALETLSISSCLVANTDSLLSRCPRLRKLRLYRVDFNMNVLSVNSPSLEELDVAATWINRVNIVAPVLKQSTVSLNTGPGVHAVSISILAPMVEKLSWVCYFSRESSLLGLWRLVLLSLQAAERQGQPPSLQIHACIETPTYHGKVASFTQDIETRLIAAFSVLELNLQTKGHAYGAFVSHVLEVNQIQCAIQRLKVDLPRLVMEEEEGCLPDCQCEFTDWKSQTIPLTSLEEVEISGFTGKDHEFDFLKLILRSAPMLKSMTIKLSQEASASSDGWTKVDIFFKAYSSVQCYVYLSSGLMHGSQVCPST